jgi:hypothetical protein
MVASATAAVCYGDALAPRSQCLMRVHRSVDEIVQLVELGFFGVGRVVHSACWPLVLARRAPCYSQLDSRANEHFQAAT